MAYKRYFYRNGKRFGPYYYNSYRDENGKVKKRYVGTENPSVKSKVTPTRNLNNLLVGKNIFYAFSIFLFILLISFSFFVLTNKEFFDSSISGNSIMDIQSVYLSGENINGILSLVIKKGELIPGGSKLIIKQNLSLNEFLLSDLIVPDFNGEYFIENTGITGSGEGIGYLGEKKVYPVINFEFILKECDNGTQISDIQLEEIQNETIESSNDSILQEEKNDSFIPENVPISESPNESETNQSFSEEQPIVSDLPEEISYEISAEAILEPEEESEQEEAPSDVSLSGITGNVALEKLGESDENNRIKGSITKNSSFEYSLMGCNSIEIINQDKGSLNDLGVSYTDNKAILTTDYFEIETGFGEDYLSDETKEIQIDLSKLNLAPADGEIEIILSYNNLSIIKFNKNIIVKNINEPVNNTNLSSLENLSLTKNIPDIEIAKNTNKIINLSEYFVNANNYSFSEMENISFEIYGNNLTIIPQTNFTGERVGKIVAYKLIEEKMINESTNDILLNIINESIESNEFKIVVSELNVSVETIQYEAVLNQPVKWIKEVEKEYDSNATIEIPIIATNVSVYEIVNEEKEKIKLNNQDEVGKKENNEGFDANSFFITGNVIENTDEENSSNFSKVLIEETEDNEDTLNLTIVHNSTNYQIEYYTEAPYSIENQSSNSSKEILIVGPDIVHYQNVLVYSRLPMEVGDISSIKLYHTLIEEINFTVQTTTNITDNETGEIREEIIEQNISNYTEKIEETSFIANDTDGNGLYDFIYWNVSHLSNQSYEISINILNVYSHPSLYGDWIVEFNTTGTANLRITASHNESYGDEYSRWSNYSEDSDLYDLKFLEIKCGNDILNYTWIGEDCETNDCSVLIDNYSCAQTGFEVSKVLTVKKHILKFEYGNQTAFAFNDVQLLKTYNMSDYASRGHYACEAGNLGANVVPFNPFICSNASYAGGVFNASSDAYLNISSSEDVKWITARVAATGNLNYDIQIYHFNISERAKYVNYLNFSWEGASDTVTAAYDLSEFVWNVSSGSWVLINTLDGGSTTDIFRSISVSGSDVFNYINETPNGNWIYIYSRYKKYYYSGGGGSCPYVYSFNGQNYSFEGEGISAFSTIKESEDKQPLKLNNLRSENKTFKLNIAEELDEISYIDSVELLEVTHPNGTSIYPGFKEQAIKGYPQIFGFDIPISFLKGYKHLNNRLGELFSSRDISATFKLYAVKNLIPPINVTENGNQAYKLEKIDDVYWNDYNDGDLSNLNLTDLDRDFILDSKNETELYKIAIFEYPKENVSSAKLLIRVKEAADQTEYITAAYYQVMKLGLYDAKRAAKSAIRESSYHISVWNGTSWVNTVSVSDSPIVGSEVIVPLNIENIKTETLKIKVRVFVGTLMLDGAYIDYSEDEPIEIKRISLANATEESKDVTSILKTSNNKRISLNKTQNINISFSGEYNSSKSYFLNMRGYYLPNPLVEEDIYGIDNKKLIDRLYDEEMFVPRFVYPRWFSNNCYILSDNGAVSSGNFTEWVFEHNSIKPGEVFSPEVEKKFLAGANCQGGSLKKHNNTLYTDYVGVYLNYTSDTTPPFYSNPSASSTIANSFSTFSLRYNDSYLLDKKGYYIFSTNNTGLWENNSAVYFTSTPSWANVTKRLNNSVGATVGYMWYATDNSGNWNNSEIFALTTTADTIPPTYSNGRANNSIAGRATNFSLSVNDNVFLNNSGYYIFSTNNTGLWENDSSVNFIATPQSIGTTKTLNSTPGLNISYLWYIYDDSGNPNSTLVYNLRMNSTPVMVSTRINSATNFSNETLKGFCNATDVDNDSVNYYYAWYKNGVLNNSGLTSSNFSQGVERNVNNLSTTFLRERDNWTLSCLANDSFHNSIWLNSSSIMLKDDSPQINFVTPSSANGIQAINAIWANITATDNSGISLITLNLYNSVRTLVNSTTSATSPFFYNFTNLASGVYYFNASVNDTLGNANNTETRTILIDALPPQINFTLPTPGNRTSTANTSIIINVSIGESNLNELKYNWNGTNYTLYNNSLVLMYNFDNNSELGENSTKVVDVSPWGNNGTVNGAVYNATGGKFGGGYSFNGTNYIDVGNVSSMSFNYNTPFSIEIWSKRSATGSLVSKMGGSTDDSYRGWDLYAGGGTNKTLFYLINAYPTNTIGVYGSTNILDNNWHHIILTYDGSSNANGAKIYVDGVAETMTISQNTLTGTTLNSKKVLIGKRDSITEPAGSSGSIDEVRIYNRSLSATEIYQLYASNLQKFNSTQWYLYVNQSKNSTAGLATGNYTYQVFAKDIVGSINSTEQRTIIIDINYPQFSSYYDNNASLNNSGTGYFNVTLANTNGTVLLEINNTNITATNLSANVYNVSYNFITNGTYPYRWHSWGNGTTHLYNNSGDRSYSVNFLDIIYPQFSNYYDNNASIFYGGVASFNVTLANTNGTVLLSINGENYTATNYTSDMYNVSIPNLPSGVYAYKWNAYGNGISRNLNVSDTRSYTVNVTPVVKIDFDYPKVDTTVFQNKFFNFTLNVTCLNSYCGPINVTLDSISLTPGAIPFYTNSSSNPITTSSLNENQNTLVVFFVNATGDVGVSQEFFAYANLTQDYSIGNFTDNLNITIESASKEIAIDLSPQLSQQISWDLASLPASNQSATGNNDLGITEYYINLSSGGTGIDLYLKANGDLMNSGLDILGLANESYSFDSANSSVPSSNKYSLTTNYIDNKIGNNLPNGTSIYLKFFLSAPASQKAGTYNNSLLFKAVPNGVAP